MLTDLSSGLHSKSHRFATFFAAIVDGVFPHDLAAMAVISPFFLQILE